MDTSFRYRAASLATFQAHFPDASQRMQLLLDAIEKKNEEKVEELCEDMNPGEINRPRYGVLALVYAVLSSTLPVMRCLVEYGADIRAEDNIRRSAALTAIEPGRDVAVIAYFKGLLALEALRKGDRAGFESLWHSGADLMAREFQARTCAHYVANSGDTVLMARLLQDFPDLRNAQDWDGTTPLMEAVRQKDSAMLKELVNRGADINIADNIGSTALTIALGLEDRGPFELLLQHIDVNALDRIGQTPLHVAVQYDSPANVRLLLERGADVLISDHSHRIPLYFAQSEAVASLLLTHGDQGRPIEHKNVDG